MPKVSVKIATKIYYSINNQVAYPFFISNEFIDFSETI